MTIQDFYSQVGLALASVKAGKFQEAYTAYGSALQLGDSTQRSHVLTAMATIAYKFQVKSYVKNCRNPKQNFKNKKLSDLANFELLFFEVVFVKLKAFV